MKKRINFFKRIFQPKEPIPETAVVVCTKQAKANKSRCRSKVPKKTASKCNKLKGKNKKLETTEEIFAKMFLDYHNKLHHSKEIGSNKKTKRQDDSSTNKLHQSKDACITEMMMCTDDSSTHSSASDSYCSGTSGTSSDDNISTYCDSSISSLSIPTLVVEKKLLNVATFLLEKINCCQDISLGVRRQDI